MAANKKTKSADKKRKNAPKFILNCLPSTEQETDWSLDNATQAGVLAAGRPLASKDLRATWWPIGDQGQTGSCVGWASADGIIRWHMATAGRLAKSKQLSVRFIWMAAKETDEFNTRPSTFIDAEGTSLKSALDIARKYGVVEASLLPFGSGVLYPNDAKTFYAIAAQLKISSYFNLGLNPNNWRTWLANNGPILTRLNVDDTWQNASDTQGKLISYQANTAQGGHAVTIVGYTKDGFIVRNSWGTTWGDKGFAYASNAYAAEAFTEAYGISV